MNSRVIPSIFILVFTGVFLGHLSAFANCEDVQIREPVPGFGRIERLYPDYERAHRINTRNPNLGYAGSQFCNGREMHGYYMIYESGAISIHYFDERITRDSGRAGHVNPLEEPFRRLCELNRSFAQILTAMNQRDLSDSEKFVVLERLRSQNSCRTSRDEIATELARLNSRPWLRPNIFGASVENLARRVGCRIEITEEILGGGSFVRLAQSGESLAFAVVRVGPRGNILAFEPLISRRNLGLLPRTDPCLRLANTIANLPSTGTPEEREAYSRRLLRLRQFDQVPEDTSILPAGFENPVVDGRAIFVSQGHGQASNRPLVTNSLMTCVGVAVLNPQTHRAFLIHADANTNVDALVNSLNRELGLGARRAVIAGGSPDEASRGTLFRILTALDRNHIPVSSRRPNSGIDGLGVDLGVDPVSGQFY